MSHGFRKLRILALMAALGLVLGLLGPGSGRESAEADLGTPGGISVLPSAAPGIPGVVNQGIPAIIRARAPGNVALVSVFCDPQAEAPWSGPNLDPSLPCPGTAPSPITFKLSRVYPPDGEAASTFSATATTELVCLTGPLFLPSLGGGPCDYNDRLGVVVVEVKGGGVNEIVRVTATDDIGESRSVDIVVVDTILAWGPNGVLSTAAQHEPAFISYACSDIGRTNVDEPEERADGPDPDDSTLPAYAEALGDDDGVLGLDDLWELMYHLASGLNFGPGMIGQAALNNNLTSDVDGLDLWWCGGDTASSIDDSVDFQTDLGVFSVDPAAVDIVGSIPDLLANFGILTPPSLDFDCGEGKDIDVSDADSLTVWASTLLGISGGEACDADFARNGVVTTSILGNGEVGVATIKAQQGGGVSPPRTINITFVGEAALSVFIDVPADIGAEGGEFDVFVVDQDGRPVGDETVECTVEPAGGALVVVPQTGTTGSIHSEDPGSLTMTLVPTAASVVAGEELTLTCVLDRERGISASTVIPLNTAPGVEEVELPAGCVLVGSTWDDGTDISTVAGAVTPAEALDAMWAFDPETGTWVGFSPDVPVAVNDLTSVDRLEPFFICMSEPGALGRPVL